MSQEAAIVTRARYNMLNLSELQAFIKAGYDVDCVHEGSTLLIEACKYGQTQLIRVLLDARASVNIRGDDSTALLIAAAYRQTSAMQLLIEESGVDLDCINDFERRPLQYVMSAPIHRPGLLLLLEANARLWTDDGLASPASMVFRDYCKHYDPDSMDFVMRILMASPDKDTGFTALMEATRQDCLNAMKALLALGANVYEKDKYGTTALDVASSEECAMLLRQHMMMSAPLPPPPESPQQDVLHEETIVYKATRNKLTVDDLKQYIAAGKDVNYQKKMYGATMLMMTVAHGQTELTQMLLDANADVNMQSNNGYTALRWATANMFPAILARLIKAGADVNMQDNSGDTALHWALSSGYMVCSSLLLDAKANLWLENVDGETPMSLGLQEHDNNDMMRLLLEHGLCKDTGFTALMEASRLGNAPAVMKLLALGANVYEKDKYGTTALDMASSEECTMLLRQHTMMSAPLPPPPESPQQDVLDEKTMLSKAELNKLTVDELKQYIAAGKNVNYHSLKRTFHNPVRKGDICTDSKAEIALMSAAWHGNLEIASLMLDAGAHVNMQRPSGYTALMDSVKNHHPDAVKLLIEHAADVNLQDSHGQTALHWAAYEHNVPCMKLLLDAKANPWIHDKKAHSPVSLSLCGRFSDNSIRIVLERCICEECGFTVLMEAVRRGYADAVEKLLALGANAAVKDKYGTTALDLAVSLDPLSACTKLLQPINVDLSVISSDPLAVAIEEKISVQTLWGGYGSIVRYSLTVRDKMLQELASSKFVIAKHIRFGDAGAQDASPGHRRKLKSYDVESQFYTTVAPLCKTCKVPRLLRVYLGPGERLLVLEDLNSMGFTARLDGRFGSVRVPIPALQSSLSWLANFHATFLNCDYSISSVLWEEGCYWHLATRQTELERMQDDDILKIMAHKLAHQIQRCKFQTIVHGDAKLQNFCYTPDYSQTAAVDFQYVGRGPGIRDVACFLRYCFHDRDCSAAVNTWLTFYFEQLRGALEDLKSNVDISDLEREWRDLFPICWVDYYRFLSGWRPGKYEILPDSYTDQLVQHIYKTFDDDDDNDDGAI